MNAGGYMKNRLLLLLSVGSLLLCGCKSDCKTNQPTRGEEKSTRVNNVHQLDLRPATADNCIQTEGDYLTAHYCINITNTGAMPGKHHILMQIYQLFSPDEERKKVSATGIWAFYAEPNEDKQYGYKATAKDRYYEIDWSKDTTYFRIWDKDRTKLIEEEPVIKVLNLYLKNKQR